jgi:hypothetical protein
METACRIRRRSSRRKYVKNIAVAGPPLSSIDALMVKIRDGVVTSRANDYEAVALITWSTRRKSARSGPISPTLPGRIIRSRSAAAVIEP